MPASPSMLPNSPTWNHRATHTLTWHTPCSSSLHQRVLETTPMYTNRWMYKQRVMGELSGGMEMVSIMYPNWSGCNTGNTSAQSHQAIQLKYFIMCKLYPNKVDLKKNTILTQQYYFSMYKTIFRVNWIVCDIPQKTKLWCFLKRNKYIKKPRNKCHQKI